MAKYHYAPLAELAHQLRLSPARLRLRQLDAAEYLIDILDSDKSYPYEFVCHQITGYRPASSVQHKAMIGKALLEDLVQLVEDVSAAAVLPVNALPMSCWTAEELAGRLQVSTKTICRWRRRGLVGRKLRYPDHSVRMAFPEPCVRRFVTKNLELVRRGAAFRQLTAAEKQQIVALARQALTERRMRLHELSQAIAARMGRAVETVRYTLRRYDAAHPADPLFGPDHQPVVHPELQAIYNAVTAGRPVEAVSREYGRTPEAIEAVVREVRARLLKSREIHYIPNREFEGPDADAVILREPEEPFELAPSHSLRPPKDLPPYLQDLYRQPLLTPERERDMFRRYNYLKYKAHRARLALDVLRAGDADLAEIETLLRRAEDVKNEILRANLRLVVSIARRHVGRSPCFFEIVSDGNLSLMRAVEKFDYARGFKFSTYASWAIMRNYARTIPEQMYQATRLVTGVDEALTSAPARNEAARNVMIEAAQQLVNKGLALLSGRERDVIVWHYGLQQDRAPMTLDQIGRIFGVTKERVRQIERKAFGKLRSALGDDGESQAVAALA